MNIIAQNRTKGRTFGMHNVSTCENINDVLGLLNVGNYSQRAIPDVCEGYSVISDDFGKPVSIVSDTYDLLQPLECFGFMDMLQSQLGFKYTEAGFTHEGKRMAIVAECGEMTVGDPKVGDVIKKRLVAKTSFDGSISTHINLELYRLWCSNGCGNWIQGDIKIRARHSKNQRNILTENINEATGINNIFLEMQDDADLMASRKITRDDAKRVIADVVPNETTRSENTRWQILAEFENNDRGTFGKTAWDLFNAFTAYRNHEQPSREGKNRTREETKFHNIGDNGFVRKIRKSMETQLSL